MSLPEIRLVHHLSSTGGTVISKCLAAQPDVVLLSEVHPLIARKMFYPIDPLAQMVWNYPDLLSGDEELYEIFRRRLAFAAERCAERGMTLVLRDHSHSDYLTAREPAQHLYLALKDHYSIRRAVTVRHPIDTWLSMDVSRFNHQLSDFRDYCSRVLKFLDDHTGIPVWRYEDFVEDPSTVVSEMCEHLAIGFDPSFIERYNTIVLTGDSGRRPPTISRLERRTTPEGFAEQVASFPEFQAIAERLNYEAGSAKSVSPSSTENGPA